MKFVIALIAALATTPAIAQQYDDAADVKNVAECRSLPRPNDVSNIVYEAEADILSLDGNGGQFRVTIKTKTQVWAVIRGSGNRRADGSLVAHKADANPKGRRGPHRPTPYLRETFSLAGQLGEWTRVSDYGTEKMQFLCSAPGSRPRHGGYHDGKRR
ncbi:MAG: hypothetical protein ABL958_11885 [Bdellovibrionia bacterium]